MCLWGLVTLVCNPPPLELIFNEAGSHLLDAWPAESRASAILYDGHMGVGPTRFIPDKKTFFFFFCRDHQVQIINNEKRAFFFYRK